jgi:hypothetical protein
VRIMWAEGVCAEWVLGRVRRTRLQLGQLLRAGRRQRGLQRSQAAREQRQRAALRVRQHLLQQRLPRVACAHRMTGHA